MFFLKRWVYFSLSAILLFVFLIIMPLTIQDSTIMGGIICFVLAAYILLTAQLIGKFTIIDWISGFKPRYEIDDEAYAKDFSKMMSILSLILMGISGVSLLVIPFAGQIARVFVIAYIAVMMVGVNTVKTRLFKKHVPDDDFDTSYDEAANLDEELDESDEDNEDFEEQLSEAQKQITEGEEPDEEKEKE